MEAMNADVPLAAMEQVQAYATTRARELAAEYPGLAVQVLHWRSLYDRELSAEVPLPPPSGYALVFRAGGPGHWEPGSAEIAVPDLADEERRPALEELVSGELTRTAQAAAQRLGIAAACPE